MKASDSLEGNHSEIFWSNLAKSQVGSYLQCSNNLDNGVKYAYAVSTFDLLTHLR